MSQSQAPPPKSGKTDEELKEEEELQLAIALSQSEAQAKEDAKKRSQLQSYSSPKVEEVNVKLNALKETPSKHTFFRPKTGAKPRTSARS